MASAVLSHRWLRFALLVMMLMTAGCSLTQQATSAPPIPPTPTLPPAPATSGDWQVEAPGVWTQQITVEPPYTAFAFEMPIVRLDPALVQVRVHYQPTFFYSIREWVDRLGDPLVVVNGSFFTEEGYAVGLVVADGKFYGNSLEGYGGMVQVSGEQVQVRSLVRAPYLNEIYEQVAQGFPMFIHPGGEAARTGEGFDDPARRTIIAQDADGLLYLMTTPSGTFTLRQAQRWLLDSEFNFDAAFGLDGGKSSGLYVRGTDGEQLYPSIEPIPVVIAVYPR